MDFRRSGQLDERRRRVLRDELAQPAETESADSAPSGSGSAKGPVRAYSPAVLEERQLRVTDLVPVRPLWAAVAILLAVTAAATIECVHIHARTLDLESNSLWAAHVAALDATQHGSVANWLAAMLLAAAAVLSLVTFGIRMHRVDDYRGRYRVWLWTAAALAWASLDATTGVHDALGLGIATLAGKTLENGSLAAAAAISWLALYGLLFGTLAIRLAIEVWCSLPSIAALAIAGLLYLIAGLGVLDMLPVYGPLVDSVVRTSVLLLAHVALFSAVALNARHVYLDATGRLKVHIDPDRKRGVKKPKARLKVLKTEKEPEDQPAVAADRTSAGPPLKFGAAASSNQPKAGAAIGKSAASSADYEDEEEDEDEHESYGGERLSRAERRRLKKLARREGQRRAA
ncbi:MAG: hypothetical protein L0211_14670 [Planctomycetaceae bacterium]|nr:hypothetical protein [Planctomycetaceae bacterium]